MYLLVQIGHTIISFFSDDFEDVPTFQSQWVVLNNANDRSYWQVTSTASFAGNNSLMLNFMALQYMHQIRALRRFRYREYG